MRHLDSFRDASQAAVEFCVEDEVWSQDGTKTSLVGGWATPLKNISQLG